MKTIFGKFVVALFCIGFVFLGLHPAMAGESGLTEKTITIGSNMILTGPAAFWGQGSDKGARAYFEFINDQGGIYGRKINFINTDNGYVPARAVAATKKLIEKDGVFVLTGYQSSACIQASEMVFGDAGVPLIAPVTTGRALAEPPRKYLFIVFTQYGDQARSLVDYMAKKPEWKNLKIAAVYQNDDFGKDGLDGLVDQAKKYPGLAVVAKEPFERGAKDFSSQVVKCKRSGAEALFLSCSVSQAAKIIREAEKIAWHPQFMVLSGAADQKLIELGGKATEGLLAATNVIMPTVGSPVLKKVTDILHKYYPNQKLNVPAIDGMAVAMVTVEALKKAGQDPTRAKVIEALDNMKGFETGILPPVTFGPGQRQGCKTAFIYQVKDGKFVSLK